MISFDSPHARREPSLHTIAGMLATSPYLSGRPTDVYDVSYSQLIANIIKGALWQDRAVSARENAKRSSPERFGKKMTIREICH